MSRYLKNLHKPCDKLDKYDNEPKSPFLNLKLSDIRKYRRHSQFQQCPLKKQPSFNDDDEPNPAIPPEIHIAKLRFYARNTPIPKMLKVTEQQIFSFLPKRLSDNYPEIVADYMSEVHEEHDRLVKGFSMYKLLKPLPDDFIPTRDDFRFKRLGKSSNYNNYLKNREKIKKNLMLLYPFVRCINYHSNIDFPEILNNFGRYRAMGELGIHDIRDFTKKDLAENSAFIKKTFYPKIIKIIRNHYGKQLKYQLTRNQWQKAWNCATGLIARQINNLKMRTIEHLNEVLLKSTQIPFLKVIAICESHIDLCPTLDEIFDMYHNFIDIINEIGNNLEPLETLIDKKKFETSRITIKVDLGEMILKSIHSKLQETLEIAYAPIKIYLESFQMQFYSLQSKKEQNDLIEYLEEPRSFDEYFEVVEKYQIHIDNLRLLIQKEFFNEAIISQSDAIESLRRIGENSLKKITASIVREHKKEIRSISNEYEEIKRRALEIPLTTEHLFETGEYMLNVKKNVIDELGERIRFTLRVTGLIVELTEMDNEHIKLQREVIDWYHNTSHIFELGGTNFETMKYQFEEKLLFVSKQIQDRLKELAPNLTIINDMTNSTKFKEYERILKKFVDQIVVFDDHVKWLNKEEVLFKFPKTQSALLESMKTFVIPFCLLIKLCIRWYRYYDVWMDGCFEYLDPKFVQITTEEFLKDFQKTQKFYRNLIKAENEFPECRFKGQLEDPDIEKLPSPLKICARMIQTIKDFRIGVHVVTIMCNPALRERHWNEMSEVAKMDLQPDAGTTLRKIINYNLPCLDECEIISIGACKELQLQQNLAAMMKEWNVVNFSLSEFKNTGITILSSIEDVQAILDDHIIKTLSMRGSAFVKPSEDEVKDWFNKLIRVQSTIEQWGKVQSTWLYLLPIFTSKDIVAQMPEEGRYFVQVDNIYKRYMMAVVKEPNVMETAAQPGLLESMIEANGMLEKVIVGVNNYLEKKRLFFPRFFFLSNDEMLEILSETKDPLRVQSHLSKCFEGINKLDFNDLLEASAMISVEGERVKFIEKVSTAAARGSVEKWLSQVEHQMLASIKDETSRSFLSYQETKRTEWITQWPGMVVLAVSQIYWCVDIESRLKTNELKDYYEFLQIQLRETVGMIRSEKISNLDRVTVKALIVIDVHAKDVLEEVVKCNVTSEDNFQWIRQLRYYMVDDAVQVRIINACVPYGYEYLGNSDRLVITPLTDRCYMTLMCAYQLHLNGAPEGPAGTGKTETTKDLAKALAVQCKVFNCSDGLDYKSMGKFFKGLAASGAWACFDEFNRIELEVLSVIAQQILSIVQAVRNGVEKFMFEGTELPLNPSCYVCITMNPGYAGRSELPDNLKVLFRSIAMMVPDYALIGEISLYSYGFVNARELSVKIVTTYRLCSEQLSSQNHYDYGMRAVKTVLQACGNLKKKFPNEREDVLLLRSLLDVNLPKFLTIDIPLFQGIISDLFPNVEIPETDYGHFTEIFKNICESMNLQPKEEFMLKVIQTFEMLIVRHGFMLVGEPLSGKTAALTVLAECLTQLAKRYPDENPYYRKVQFDTINPKSITLGQLYGAFDPVSMEWSDGVAATLFRNYASDPSPDRKWIIFDGPVDAVWIENMNTVLDDNKKLCLTSGEVITMSQEMSMIFEVMDLAQASPATVSRCGMIYMETIVLGWEAFALSWLNVCNPMWAGDHKVMIMGMFRWIIPDCLTFIKRNCQMFLKSSDINIILSTFSIFEMLLNDACEENQEEYAKFLTSWFQAAISYAVMWGLGGIMNTESRTKFDEFYREIWNKQIPTEVGRIEVTIPPDGLIFDYVYIFKQKGAWKLWPDLVRNMKIETGVAIQVPTIDTARYSHMFNLHFKYQRPFLLVGPTGTGKSFYIQNNLMKLPEETYVPAFVTFTTQITANQVQELVLSKLIKKRKGIYGPPQDRKCILFIDDMNMPAKDEYGAQAPIELIRQYFDKKHWYDTKDTTKIYLKDLLIVAACGLVGGSRQDVYARFLCHFNIFAINLFSDETNFKIFHSILVDVYKRNGHPNDVIQSCNNIVSSTIEIYNFAIKNILPTPSKSHYVFNLRDISRVITGCGLLRRESTDTKKMFTKIWCHETLRVFFDRLMDDKDRVEAFKKINKCIQTFFKDKPEELFEDLMGDGPLTYQKMNGLLFGSYFDMDTDYEDRKYELIQNVDAFRNLAYQCLDEYNSTHKTKMDVVLFEYALQHLNKICRIMSLPGGSALLVGMSGSGRQSMATLAAAILNQSLFQPEITKNYGLNEFRDDLKIMLKEAGGLGKDTVFLFTEGQMKMEEFLQDIDCLLNLGEVPNIYQIEEKQELLEMVRLAAQGGNRNLDIPPLQVFQFFVNRCKLKLHLVLCFSPIGSSFRNRIRLYPSLVNCCTIDWYDDWPEDALEMVAHKFIKDMNIPDDIKDSVVKILQNFHTTGLRLAEEFYQETGRVIYFTSASYLEVIKSFCGMIKKKQKEVLDNKMRYLVGLDRLQAAADTVAQMQIDLEAKQPELIILAEDSRRMMEEIEKESMEAELATEQVKRDEIVANKQAAESLALNAECEKDLASAIPILEDAIQSLNTLKPADITLVKSMKNPPDTVKLVMAAVCVMKSVPPDKIADSSGKKILDFWGPSKKLLGDMQFLQSLKDYDKDNIKPEIMVKIRKDFIPHKDFQPSIVAKASSAAEGLCKWIIAMNLYDAVAKVVAPKKAKLEESKRIYEETMILLAEKRELAAQLEMRVIQLNNDLDDAQLRRQMVEDEVELCRKKLIRAETLLGGLGGEGKRWVSSAGELQSIYDCLPGDVLISCGLISYLSPLTTKYRTKAVTSWHKLCTEMKIPQSLEFNFIAILGSEIKIQNWNINGLPRDLFSIENGIIMENSSQYSLFIDPQNQANKWIKEMERNNQLYVVKFSQKDYMKTIENCIENGHPVLIENIYENLEAPLDPLLKKQTFMQGGYEFISLGENVLQMSPNFRLYMTTSLRNPHYLPEVFNKVTVINFALTIEGLEDQLLGIVVAKERPDLQELREELTKTKAKNQEMLKAVEDNILKTLSESTGDILEDESAIRMLDDSKVLAVDIKSKQEESVSTELLLETFRESYHSVATHAATIYYSITDLPNVDPMYQFSLSWYINLFIFSIENANKSKEIMKRLKFLIDAITINLYNNVCRSLFEKDKLLFSFILTTKIMISNQQMTLTDLDFLFTSKYSVDMDKFTNPDPSWITEKIWWSIARLSQLKGFKGFIDDFKNHLSHWKSIFNAIQPEKIEMPGIWNSSLTTFEKLLVLNAIRPDKLTAGIAMFIESQMGSKFNSPPPFDIGKSFEDSNCLTPVIFILSPGVDPMQSIISYAEKLKFDETFQSVSLGQGQGEIARRMIEKAQVDGGWVCLQNCHLAESWMPTLEMMWEKMDMFNTDPTFRLWLTSYPSKSFPQTILQNGVKITNEPPTGLQKNLLRSYNSEPMNVDSFYSGCPDKDRAFTKLLYGISFFHAVVQERRKFGALGWNILYGFNESDFQITVQQLQMFLNEYVEIPFDAISYLTGECNYGGRVTDAWDRRTIVTILKDFVNEDVVNDPIYKFTKFDETYIIPRRVEHREVVKHVNETIPNDPSPEIFGLHPNAGIIRDLNESLLLAETFNSTLVQSVKSSSDEDLILGMVEDILQRLPKDFDVEQAQEKYPIDYNESMNTVLVQEMERLNILLREIRKSCENLRDATSGKIVMTAIIENVSKSLTLSKIPTIWTKKSYPSLKNVGSYITDFIKRLDFLQTWYENGKPACFWISGFFFTQAFLTGVTQNYARKYKIPIDTLTFDFNILDFMDPEKSLESPTDGVYVHGLYIEGARWDVKERSLNEQHPKVIINNFPLIHFIPLIQSNFHENSRYKSPLYKTSERKGILSTTGHSTNYVIALMLDTKVDPQHWIKRGVALLCQDND
ncbi:CLUMA_CG011958, isoform A [Clunio marinus]|uniref:CLUMA_CG011958, isoform A n=1 Tax=Clunio marinus TaxID=568069 RepID=A0A1J1IHF6_9DIPT|nr:CLUMA_CG011958, isoform A [Clunio marinus]